MSTAAKTIQFLKGQSVTAQDAVERLTGIVETFSPLGLFQHYFPKEFAAQGIDWKTGAGVMQACCTFSELVDQRLFPCCSFWAFGEGNEDYCDDIIFEAPFPAWYDDNRDPTELGRLEEVVLLQCGYLERRGEELAHAQKFEHVSIDPDLLEQLCERKRGPVRWLSLAVKFFLKGTGNFWCDLTQEECDCAPDWPSWSKENIEWLRKDWVEARKISSRVSEVEDWIGESPANRAKVEDLLRQAIKRPTGEPQRLRVSTQGTPLIQQMDDWDLEDEDE